MGFLTDNFIADFFVMVMRWMYTFIGDYSVSIIVLTILIRVVLLPLDLKQKKSARRMAQLKPQLDSLKKRYANNPQQLQKKQSELYKKEGVKPLAGCLPMLIQLPILFAFFGAMRVLAAEQTISLILNAVNDPAAAELPRWLWVNNLWQPDSGLANILPNAAEFKSFIGTNASYLSPQVLSLLQQKGLILFGNAGLAIQETAYNSLTTGILSANGLAGLSNGWFILPVLAGGSLFLQQKLSAQSGQQMQQGKFMLWFFPLFSVYICAVSNAAFALYWMTTNVYALIQLVIMNRIYKIRDKQKKLSGEVT